jgi:hypothetical protein
MPHLNMTDAHHSPHLGISIVMHNLIPAHRESSHFINGTGERLTGNMTEVLTSQTPPILHGPSEKEKKYDRQLRLWAASGQAALESAHILFLNLSGSGTVGYETLKNLVLPGG